ncbi:MAG: hypothetical protein NXI13_10680 [Proteobacteria bacterium]|nr:hypothetical protein [Pseudomonadota bacterium]
MIRLFLLSIGLVFVLAACTSGSKITTVSPQKPEVKEPEVQTQPSSNVASKPLNTAPVVISVKPRVLLEPEILIGKTPKEIETAFGQPHLLRKDEPAEVWQYLADGCALNLFFFPNGSGQGLMVNHIAINGRDVASQNSIDSKQCFNDHLREVGAEDQFLANPAS